MIILHKRVAELSEVTLERFVLRARKACGLKALVNVLVTSSAEVRALNRQFRKKNKTTDVLSFPSAAVEGAIERKAANKKSPRIAGDIAISAEIAAQNAVRLGHSVALEVKILTLHGILHLAGYDHECDDGQMARKEFELRRKLKLPVGLIERVESSQKTLTKEKPASRRIQKISGARRTA